MSLESELGNECELEFDVPINAYNASEQLEKERRKNSSYFSGINFQITMLNNSSNKLGVTCRKQDAEKLNSILKEYFLTLKQE
ncbi:MAG: hypothetical protein V1886_02355 [archaeon]